LIVTPDTLKELKKKIDSGKENTGMKLMSYPKFK
jgi:hypothetical protein